MDSFNIQSEVEISAKGARRLRQGHLWVYAADVTKQPENADPAIVKVVDTSRNVLGYAFFSRHSQIRLRLMARASEQPGIDLLRSRIRTAVARRGVPDSPDCARRLVYGEADLLPSIIVDSYGPYLVLQTLSSGTDKLKPLLIEVLREQLNPSGILERNDVRARRLEGLEALRGVLWGTVPDSIQISEAGVRFDVDLYRGQKTGFFLDQSENRVAVSNHASGRALDCFSNTGGFALHMARRCDSVLAIDSSEESLQAARKNAQLNGITNVEFQAANVFDFLREMERTGEKFDVVCLDPPAFAKNRSALNSAKAGYKEINLRSMKLLKPDGILATCSCSYNLSETDLYDLLQQASLDAHRQVQILERRGQARDHPVLMGVPETHYLKCFVLRVL